VPPVADAPPSLRPGPRRRRERLPVRCSCSSCRSCCYSGCGSRSASERRPFPSAAPPSVSERARRRASAALRGAPACRNCPCGACRSRGRGRRSRHIGGQGCEAPKIPGPMPAPVSPTPRRPEGLRGACYSPCFELVSPAQRVDGMRLINHESMRCPSRFQARSSPFGTSWWRSYVPPLRTSRPGPVSVRLPPKADIQPTSVDAIRAGALLP
jgi:hypothetical protein